MYKPLEIKLLLIAGIEESLKAMRLPKKSKSKGIYDDIRLAKQLIKAGDEHAKFARGIEAWIELSFGVDFLVELATYKIGIDDLSTTSTMHCELKNMKGEELAEEKNRILPETRYTRIIKVNYQTLFRIYKQRKNHRHPDWKIFCDFIETLLIFEELFLED